MAKFCDPTKIVRAFTLEMTTFSLLLENKNSILLGLSELLYVHIEIKVIRAFWPLYF